MDGGTPNQEGGPDKGPSGDPAKLLATVTLIRAHVREMQPYLHAVHALGISLAETAGRGPHSNIRDQFLFTHREFRALRGLREPQPRMQVENIDPDTGYTFIQLEVMKSLRSIMFQLVVERHRCIEDPDYLLPRLRAVLAVFADSHGFPSLSEWPGCGPSADAANPGEM
ncbi:hypothetical protein ACHAQA_009576 [Verticillium albo-atrum]